MRKLILGRLVGCGTVVEQAFSHWPDDLIERGCLARGCKKTAAATPATTTPLPTAIAHLGTRAFLATGRKAPPRMGARPATGCSAGNWSAAAASASPSLATRAPGKGRAAGPAFEPESPSNSRLNPRSAPAVGRLLPAGEDSGEADDGLSGASVGRGAPAGVSGDNLGAGAPVGAGGGTAGAGDPPGGKRADAGIGGGAAPLRPVPGPAAPASFGCPSYKR